jgi:hypothetical protein
MAYTSTAGSRAAVVLATECGALAVNTGPAPAAAGAHVFLQQQLLDANLKEPTGKSKAKKK